MATREADVGIVGGGAFGAAAAHHCARRGARVVVFERFRRGHAFGSSHGHSRVIRQAYFEHPDYVPLLRRTYELFRALEAASGETLFVQCGALFAGPPSAPVVAGSLLAAERYGVAHERLSSAEITARFPQFRVDPKTVGVFEPGAGFVRPEATVLAHLALAERDGTEVLEETPVVSWSADATGVTITTPRDEWRVGEIILAAGSWGGEMLRAGGASGPIRLQPTRQPLLWVEPEDADRSMFTAPTMPVWLVDGDDGSATYGIPAHPAIDGPPGMKVAIHAPGDPIDPHRIDRTVTRAEIALIEERVRAVVPRAIDRVSGAAVCMYTYSDDGHFVVDSIAPHVHLAGGCSGHGFKFAPVVGEALADLALTGRTELPIAFLSSRRFA